MPMPTITDPKSVTIAGEPAKRLVTVVKVHKTEPNILQIVRDKVATTSPK